MKPTGPAVLVATFLASALVAWAGMLWNLQETRGSFPPGSQLMLVAAVVIAAVARGTGRSSSAAVAATIATAMPAGAFLAQLPELVQDPMSKTLWPIGLALLAVLVLVAAFGGALAGSLMPRTGAHK